MAALPHPILQPDAPQPGAGPALTLVDYLALDEVPERRFELVAGALVVTPSASGGHQNASLELAIQLRQRLPGHLKVLQDLDVNLALVPFDRPATVRKPDVLVVSDVAYKRIRDGGSILDAADVLLAVEIISPSSRRTDARIKHAEYADAGIPHYWIVDLRGIPSLTVCHHGGEFGYIDAPSVTGLFETVVPFPARIDVSTLLD
jgi:Uma2 family endonuclease